MTRDDTLEAKNKRFMYKSAKFNLVNSICRRRIRKIPTLGKTRDLVSELSRKLKLSIWDFPDAPDCSPSINNPLGSLMLGLFTTIYLKIILKCWVYNVESAYKQLPPTNGAPSEPELLAVLGNHNEHSEHTEATAPPASRLLDLTSPFVRLLGNGSNSLGCSV